MKLTRWWVLQLVLAGPGSHGPCSTSHGAQPEQSGAGGVLALHPGAGGALGRSDVLPHVDLQGAEMIPSSHEGKTRTCRKPNIGQLGQTDSPPPGWPGQGLGWGRPAGMLGLHQSKQGLGAPHVLGPGLFEGRDLHLFN